VSLTAGLFEGSRDEWDAYVRGHPQATFAHQYEWLQMVHRVYGGRPYYLAAWENGRLVGILPLMLRWLVTAGRVLVSVPFADEGGVCANSPEAVHALLTCARELAGAERAAYVELRQLRPTDFPDVLCDTSRVVFRMPLPNGVEKLWQSIPKKMRWMVRRARRAGLTCSIGAAELLDAFYPIYVHHMRSFGSPMHSLGFFEGLFDAFPEAALAVHVKHGDQVAAVAVAMEFNGSLTLVCSSSLLTFRNVFPNNLLYWQLLELAIERGCSFADFGRSPRGTGIYEFKKHWGMEECQLYRYILPVRGRPQLTDMRDSFAHRAFAFVWRRIPVGLAKTLGPPIFSRLPI
jgi:FemAB-related protein (PEP-CTERM system-associated)